MNIIKLERRSPFDVSLLLPFDYTCYKNLLSFLMFFLLLVFQTYFSSPRFDAREGKIFVCRGDSRVTSEIRVLFQILGAEN